MNRFIEEILSRLRVQFDPAMLAEVFTRLITDVIVGLMTFAAFYLLWWIADHVTRAALRRGNVDATSSSFIMTLLKFIMLTFGVMQALTATGINTAALLTSLGIAGLTIGFAARDSLSNLISGILIFLDRPFVIGDLVEVEGHYGRVDRITLRSTRVVTSDGRMLAVPNSSVINSIVASYTNFPNLRLDVAVTISVKEDVDRARDMLLGLVHDDPDYMKDPQPRVVVTGLNDYNTAIELQAWIHNERQHVVKRFELREKIFKSFTAAGIEMPFETIQIAPIDVRTINK